MSDRPKVGVGVLIVKDGKILIGLRSSPHGVGTWGLPGGHLEFGESFAGCALREVAEEAGVTISEPTYAALTNDVFASEDKHYVTIFVQAEWLSGEPQRLEPEKLVEWRWVGWDDLPTPLFLPLQHLVDSGFRP